MASRSKRIMAAALSAVMITSSVPQLTSVVGYAAEETVTLTAPSNLRGLYNSIKWDKPDDTNVQRYYYELTYNGETKKGYEYNAGIKLDADAYGKYTIKVYSADYDRY